MKKRDAFLQALLNCTSITEAGIAAGISRSTGTRFLRDPEFRAELTRLKAEAMSGACRFLQGNLSKCAEELMAIVNDKSTPAAVRLQAIQTIFSAAKSLTETSDILVKLAEIEEKIKQEETSE